jgi:hypothetical protein
VRIGAINRTHDWSTMQNEHCVLIFLYKIFDDSYDRWWLEKSDRFGNFARGTIRDRGCACRNQAMPGDGQLLGRPPLMWAHSDKRKDAT